jgi:hypothetical protein
MTVPSLSPNRDLSQRIRAATQENKVVILPTDVYRGQGISHEQFPLAIRGAVNEEGPAWVRDHGNFDQRSELVSAQQASSNRPEAYAAQYRYGRRKEMTQRLSADSGVKPASPWPEIPPQVTEKDFVKNKLREDAS